MFAENIRNGIKRHACSARIWFASLSVPTRFSLYNILRNRNDGNIRVTKIAMPKMEHYPLSGPNCEKEGNLRYLQQKERREKENEFSQLMDNFELTEWVDRSLCAREYDQNRPAATVSILSRVECQ